MEVRWTDEFASLSGFHFLSVHRQFPAGVKCGVRWTTDDGKEVILFSFIVWPSSFHKLSPGCWSDNE